MKIPDMAHKDSLLKDMMQNSTNTYSRRKSFLHSNPKRRALQALSRRAASAINFAFAVAVLMIPLATQAGAQSDNDRTPLVNCGGGTRSYWVDFISHATWCFDGPIGSNLDLSAFRRLSAGDRVVMRSEGGSPFIAMQLSDILREKNVEVILHDYCLGACADYVFVANRTVVRKDTIVAWRGRDSILGKAVNPWCRGSGQQQEPRKRFDQNGVPVKEPVEDAFCALDELNRTFFQERELDGRYINAPQTSYTKQKVRSALMKETDPAKVLWMWNPKNYGDHFKSKVSFDSYPRSQREVDSIVARHQLGIRVIFDP
jgi:hypothetical protein